MKMTTRNARNQTEIDLLPPFGKPEVITTGSHSLDVALGGLAVVGGIAYLSSN